MKTKADKQFKVCLIVIYAILFALMIFGTFYDLEIDKALFNSSSAFGIFLEEHGTLPSKFVQVLGFSVLIVAYHPLYDMIDIAQSLCPFIKKIRNSTVFLIVSYVLHKIIYIALFYGSVAGSDDCVRNLCKLFFGKGFVDILEDAGMSGVLVDVIWTVVRIAFSVIVIMLLKKFVNKKLLKSLEFMAIVGLLMNICSNLIGVLKDIFTRIRFREMIAYSNGLINENGMSSIGDVKMPREWIANTDFSAFGRWYQKGNDMGIYSSASSFPSGHTTGASYSMLLIPLFYREKSYQKFFIPATIVGFGVTAAVAVSRLIVGAHYLTDVVGATIIMFTSCMVMYYLVDRLEKRSIRNLNNY